MTSFTTLYLLFYNSTFFRFNVQNNLIGEKEEKEENGENGENGKEEEETKEKVEKSGNEKNPTIENDATVTVALDFELGFSNGAEITCLEIKCKYSKRRCEQM